MANNLRDIMDTNHLFRMIYSGVENEKYFNLLYNMGIRDFLMSFHYIHEKNIDMSIFKDKGVKFLIDSGAHTYQNDAKYLDYPLEYWEEHLMRYLAWAEENREYIFAIASFDFENLVGAEKVREWYVKYFEPFMLRTGIPVCFVWHQNSASSWESYCERYPYVGFSSVNTEGEAIKFEEYVSKIRIAQKHNSLVHGFGMTRTSILPKVPFFTSDSTTWLVGLQYGEVNYWNGTKMSRLKKEKWKGDYLEDIVKKAGLDKEKFLAEDSIELIKANVHAFIEAEEYIHTKLKPRMYWLYPDKVENDREFFDFPSVDWLLGNTDYDNWEEYAKNMNINPEQDKDMVIDHIFNMTLFLNIGNPEYEELVNESITEQSVIDVHQFYINSICADHEERLEDLEKFFADNLEGRDNKLLLMGTNFDVVAKERDKYIEEEEFEQVDVSEQEYNKLVSDLGLLPSPDSEAPEIDDLDKEIFDQTGYVAVRDEKGRFLKGQKTVKKPKHIYSEKYPKLACSTCYAAQTCPEYKEGYVCAFNKMFKRFDCRKTEDILEAMQGMVNLNMERMQREAIFETLNGGMAGGTLTNLIDQNMRLLMNMKQVYNANEAVVKQVRTIQADGTVQETTQLNSNGGSGVMEMLMKNMMNKDKKGEELDINDVIDVKPEDIKEIN